MWRQVGGPAGAVMCETRGLGIKWPQWHTWIFEGEAKKMLVQQARSVRWKKWAAKHEYEELKEGVWLEPAQALLGKKRWKNGLTNIEMLRGNYVWKEGWVQKGLFDIGRSDESKCQACHKVEGTEKHRLYHCPEWYDVRRGIPDACRKMGAKSENLKGVEIAKRFCNAPSQ